jgi:DNA-binding transcriptional MocR family regulator
MGFIACPLHLRDAIEKSLQATSLQPGTLTQFLVSELLKDFDYESHLDRLRQRYAARASALASRLATLGVESDATCGGFFLWARTPVTATDFIAKARSRGLLAVPESAFRAPGLPGPDNHIRLAFSRYLDDAASQSRLRAAFGAEDVL